MTLDAITTVRVEPFDRLASQPLRPGFGAERRSRDTMRSALGMSLDVARDERIKITSSYSNGHFPTGYFSCAHDLQHYCRSRNVTPKPRGSLGVPTISPELPACTV